MSLSYDFVEWILPVVGIFVTINLLVLVMRSVRSMDRTGFGGTSVVHVKKPIQETQVQSFSAPATVYGIKDLGNGTVELDIRTHLENCKLVAYWGVRIKDFPWPEAEPPHQHKEEHLLGFVNSHRLRLDVKDCDLGDQPRTHYHLVTVITAPGADSMLYSIYHLYGCSLKTSLLKQYLKSGCGSILAVRPIFNESRCVICMDAPATYTLLPCRHSCMCAECMPNIQDRCPLCRDYVESYFVTNPHDA